MRPDFNFLVEPWSMRGTEMTHGDIYVAVGIALLAGLLAATGAVHLGRRFGLKAAREEDRRALMGAAAG